VEYFGGKKMILPGKGFGGKMFWRENVWREKDLGGKDILAGKTFWREKDLGGGLERDRILTGKLYWRAFFDSSS
jgi:hypothetical protein